jgi:hypothetical protein
MNKRYFFTLLLFFLVGLTSAQPGGKPLRVADSIPAKEAAGQYRVILRSELDSLIKLYTPLQADVKEPAITPARKDTRTNYLFPSIILLLVIVSGTLVLVYRQRRELRKLTAQAGSAKETLPVLNSKQKTNKKHVSVHSLEEKIGSLHAELHKLSKENEGMSRVITEYNGIQSEYDSLKQGMQGAYKIRNYPGIDKAKNEKTAMRSVLDTEKALAVFAYEKFLKPLLAITDANKNNPAKLNIIDREKILDLLFSLSFLYIEYLYLRVSDLSVGGNMVERIKAFTQGKTPDPLLLKQLNTESGSRALVMRLALNKAQVDRLSYPVFDETNLNQL